MWWGSQEGLALPVGGRGGGGLRAGLLAAERQMQGRKGVIARGLRWELKAIHCGCLWSRKSCCPVGRGPAHHAKGFGFYPQGSREPLKDYKSGRDPLM